jgi:hypothetical protein
MKEPRQVEPIVLATMTLYTYPEGGIFLETKTKDDKGQEKSITQHLGSFPRLVVDSLKEILAQNRLLLADIEDAKKSIIGAVETLKK